MRVTVYWISVVLCDDGKSTGILREEFNVPAVGDIRRVLVSLSETEPLVEQLFNYMASGDNICLSKSDNGIYIDAFCK